MTGRWKVFLERVAWTLIQVASAEGIVQAYEAATGQDLAVIWTVFLATVLAAVKNAAAQALGSESGATLPVADQPVLADKVRVKEGDHGESVAWYSRDGVPAGESVTVFYEGDDALAD